jgi:hypothetical protein
VVHVTAVAGGATVIHIGAPPDIPVSNVAISVQSPFYPDGSSVTTVVVVVTGTNPGTAVIHASALPFIPDVAATIVVQ